MSVVFLIHHEDDGEQPMRLAVQQMCDMYGYDLRCIDCTGKLLAMSRDHHRDLDDALNDPRFAGWDWVFFDSKSSRGLDTFQHPSDNVVYAFGSDLDGWGVPISALPGSVLHLKSGFAPERQHLQMLCVMTAIVHRFYQVDLGAE